MCPCGKSFSGKECAHTLSNWLIEDQGFAGVKNAPGVECCPAGRPIRSKEMASVDIRPGVFESVLGLSKHFNPPPDGANCFIYCEIKVEGRCQGHVYYGTKDHCVAGTGSGTYHGASYYQYYY